MRKYFGTDGVRGRANIEPLTADFALKLGRAAAGLFKNNDTHRKIIIGKDTRLSCYMFENALVSGICSAGIDAVMVGVIPTPAIAFLTKSIRADAGVVISASHNPYYDNGIKIINGNGYKMEAEVEEQIERYIDGEIEEIPLAQREEIGRTIDHSAGRNHYIGYLISTATRSFKDFKVGLDCSNGSASAIAKSVFDALGAKTYVINNDPDGFNINTNCGSTHIEVLQQFVKEKGLDVGFAYDGDADRCIAVDNAGNIVDGDLILYVCGKYLKEKGALVNDTVVTTVMSNMGLYKAFDKAGIRYEKTAVGDKYVFQNMMENGHCLGGEQSGHIIFSKYGTTGDGIMTSIRIMEAITEKKQDLATLASEVRIFPQLLQNVRVKNKAQTRADEAVVAMIEQVEQELGENGRVLVRESGTEPVIRVMVEADTDELCKVCVEKIVQVMKERGLTIA